MSGLTNEKSENVNEKSSNSKSNDREPSKNKKNMQGGNLYIETTPSSFFKESLPRKKHVIKKKWLSFKI